VVAFRRLPRPPFSSYAALFGLAVTVAVVAVASSGCNPACRFRKTINEPENLSMRRSLLRKGMGDFCQQMTSRSAPLKLSPDSPVIGRFFPTNCTANQDDQLYAKFAGFGYGWTNVTKRVTFTMSGAALYRYDFSVLEDGPCDIYAYFRPSRVDSSDFRVNKVEGAAASVFNAFTNMGDTFGKQLVGQKLKDGFTVISYDGSETNVDFGLGIIPKGQKPFHPYDRNTGERDTYESERTEIHQNQRDFVGPIAVTGSGKALFVTANVDGAPAVDVLYLRKEDGDLFLRQYFDAPTAGPLATPPIMNDVLQAGVEMKRAVPVPPGMYYVIFDNTGTAGQVAPIANVLDDRAAVVNYLIQVGDAS
jgi:hypothetical protein